MNDLNAEFLQQRAELLYTFDENNRLTGINEEESEQAIPYFYLMRTAQHTLCRIRHDVPDAIAHYLKTLVETELLTSDLQAPLHQQAYYDLLARHFTIDKIELGPAYRLPESTPTEKTVLITPKNRDVLRANFAYGIREFDDINPIVVYVVDGDAVAICFCARRTNFGAEAGVYTVEAYRGNGYAPLVVRDWSIAIHQTNRLPLYSTSHHNLASQAVANKLGAIQYGTDFSLV
ncbi:MAG: GNAT family N-acetyltransferase [Chloroflexota bacterium]